jgi:hypothetical protein
LRVGDGLNIIEIDLPLETIIPVCFMQLTTMAKNQLVQAHDAKLEQDLETQKRAA